MALDGLHVWRHAPWRQVFEAKLLTFPTGRHDGQVDAIGLVGQLLNQMLCGQAPKSRKPARRDGCWHMFDERERDARDWRVA